MSDHCLFAVPAPSVMITSSNTSDDTGAAVTLTCSVTFDPNLSSFVNTSVTWLREDIPILNATETESVFISSSALDSQFTSNLTLYSTNVTETANFTCRAFIIPTGELTSLVASDFQEETVPVTIQGELHSE